MEQYKAVFFDMDGLLIDSEKFYIKYWMQAAEILGYSLSFEKALYLRSCDSILAQAYLGEMFHDRSAYMKIRSLRKQLMQQYVNKADINVKDGVIPLLSHLKDKNIRSLVVTSSEQEKTQNYLSSKGLSVYITQVISVKDVKRGKPFSDVYQLACSIVQLNPKDVIVFEDSPNGIESAFAAGCDVVMVPDLSKPDEQLEKKIKYKFDNLADAIFLF